MPALELPRVALVRQRFARERIDDVGGAVRAAIDALGELPRLHPGARIAITAGSRGIAQIPAILAAIVSSLRARGAEPFIVPAMGSYGGASADGQREVLAGYGITPEAVGAPILAS